MKVDIDKKNKALEQVLSDRAQQIFLDANFLIPPDRSSHMRLFTCFIARIAVIRRD